VVVITGFAVHNQNEHVRAFSLTVDPGTKPGIVDRQLSQNGWSAPTSLILDVGNKYKFCYPENELPPTLGDNKVLNHKATLDIMNNEKRPEILRMFKFVNFVPQPTLQQEDASSILGKSPNSPVSASVPSTKFNFTDIPVVVKNVAPAAAKDFPQDSTSKSILRRLIEGDTIENVTRKWEAKGFKVIPPTADQSDGKNIPKTTGETSVVNKTKPFTLPDEDKLSFSKKDVSLEDSTIKKKT
jgi:hypothetical protein